MKLLTAVVTAGAIGAAGHYGSALQSSGHVKNDGSTPVRPVTEVVKEHNKQLADALKQIDE